jgi:hypothetical protein
VCKKLHHFSFAMTESNIVRLGAGSSDSLHFGAGSIDSLHFDTKIDANDGAASDDTNAASDATTESKSNEFETMCKRWMEIECIIQRKNQEKKSLETEKKQLQPVIQQFLSRQEEHRRKLQWSWSESERQTFGDTIGIEWYQGDSRRDMTGSALKYLMDVLPGLFIKHMQDFVKEYDMEPDDLQRFIDTCKRASSSALQDAYTNSPVRRTPTIRCVTVKKRKRGMPEVVSGDSNKRQKVEYQNDSEYG